MCAPQEGDDDWRTFLQAPSQETAGLLGSVLSSARSAGTVALLDSPDLRRRSRKDTVHSILADATARVKIESRSFDPRTTASSALPERDGKQAAEILAEGGRR
jgi:hypothetical protein